MTPITALLSEDFSASATADFPALDATDLFRELHAIAVFANGWLLTSLPRGGLQIGHGVRPVGPGMRKRLRGASAEDRAAWQAIVTGEAMTGEDAWGEQAFHASRFRVEMMRREGLDHVMAAPVGDYLLPGYAGVVELFRTVAQGPFTPDEVAEVAKLSEKWGRRFRRSRDQRIVACGQPSGEWVQRPAERQFIFDAHLQPILGGEVFELLDERLRKAVRDDARQRLARLNGQAVTGDRLRLPDGHGDLWTFRVVVFKRFPALGDGPTLFYLLQPTCSEWAALREGDFTGDPDVARLIPALDFMAGHFRDRPKLAAIAKAAKLSPYYFHRRFTEMLGLTPKHYLLSCQLDAAKPRLIEGELELSQVAKACGFAHQSHFTSRFKQTTGLAPTHWRRLVAGGKRTHRAATE